MPQQECGEALSFCGLFNGRLPECRNGAAESFIKKTKITLAQTYGGKCLTFQELEMALKRAAYIMNSLPMSAICCMKGGVDPDFIRELTPNMLLLGRGYFSNI